MNSESVKVFDILGHKIRLAPSRVGVGISPEEVVDYVREVAGKVKEQAPNLDSGKVFLLAALRIAEQRMELAHEYRENIDLLQSSLVEAVDFIDQAAPTG